MKKLVATLILLAGLSVVFLLWPSPIDPAAYEPASPPEMVGVLEPNEKLRGAERLAEGRVKGPEDIAVDAEGRIYGGTEDGLIVRLDSSGEGLETFADTGGRPLGLHFDAEGRLVVADAAKGLLRLDTSGQIETLTTASNGMPFRFTDDLDIASDGRIYFSDASSRFDHHHYLFDLLEARAHGRLLRYDPATGQTETLLSGLYFANGVALSQNEDFVLVNETYRYRIRRYWLKGPRAGEDDLFADNLPGFPDGVSANRQGIFWAALFTVRNRRADRMHPSPFTKKLVAKLPRFAWPKPAPYGLVLAYDEQGRIVRNLQDPGGETIPQATSAEQVGETLYLGNLNLDFMARYALD